MVLAQLASGSRKEKFQSSFHPTMVLAQLLAQRGIQLLVPRFHPTMVLAQQPLLQKIIQDYRG